MYSVDAAEAIVALLDSTVEGAVNIGSGEAIMLRELVLEAARQLDAQHLVRLGAIPSRANDVPLVVADVARLKSALGWSPAFDLKRGVSETISWWREHLTEEMR
jgi:nucleoside-diphosphate-sugar epimerase